METFLLRFLDNKLFWMMVAMDVSTASYNTGFYEKCDRPVFLVLSGLRQVAACLANCSDGGV